MQTLTAANPIYIPNSFAQDPGNVYVIDLFGVGADSQIEASFVDVVEDYIWKGPLFITSGAEPGQFLVSNAKNYNRGLAGVSFKIDPETGNLAHRSSVAVEALKPEKVPGWLQSKYQQNIQRAAGTVVLEYQGKTYALVADYNFLFNDSHFGDWAGYGAGKQIGGKIGVIQDPFGEDGPPIFMGATTPIPGAALEQLTLDQNGMLYANAFVTDSSGRYTGGSHSEAMYRSVFVWNASQLVQAAIAADQAGIPLTMPFDRNGGGRNSIQYPAVTPARYDSPDNSELFGWIYGIGSYAAQQGIPHLSLQYLPALEELAPSIFKAAQSAALAAKLPVADVVDKSNPTIETFAVRTLAQVVALTSQIGASVQALIGMDNSRYLAQMEDAQSILRHTGYNTSSDGFLGGHFASAVRAIDGIVGGIAMIGTNVIGVAARDLALVEGLTTGVTPQVPTPTEFLEMLASNASASDKFKEIGMDILKYNPITLGVEAVYRVGAAAIEGNWEELRNASYDLLAFAYTMKSAKESPAFKRELQLKTKQVDFIKQRLERGVIEKTPLKDIVYKEAEVKQYVREAARRDAEGKIVEPERVVDIKDFAKACDDLVEINTKGEVVYKTCFAAGTLVHTDQGPQPIETLRIGTRVLAQPEAGGELDYRPIINKVAHLNQAVYAVQVKVEGVETLTTLITTGSHPFWVEAPLVDGKHWMAAECMEPGFVVQLADGRPATIYAAGLIRRTQYDNIGFASDDRSGVGVVLELRDKQVSLASEASITDLAPLELGENYLTPVYNFEVEEFHTYYVGDTGVWVHNTNCTGEKAGKAAITKAEFEGECFPGDTIIYSLGGYKHNNGPYPDSYTYEKGDGTYSCNIESIKVGEYVLSRCEITGAMAYKEVTTVFEHGFRPICKIGCQYPPEFVEYPPSITATEEHPFWVEGKGWTKVRDLQPGDEFVTFDGEKVTCTYVETYQYPAEVFNIEVADFHTYFIGSAGIWVHNKSKLEFNTLKNDTVPKAEWSPLHDSEVSMNARRPEVEARLAELNKTPKADRTVAQNAEIKDLNIELDAIKKNLRENPAQKSLSAADIDSVKLPDQNTVIPDKTNWSNNLAKNGGYADIVLKSRQP